MVRSSTIRTRLPWAGLLVLILAAFVPAAPAAAHLGPAPNVCGPVPGCLTRGSGGDMSVSPRIVEVGQVVTFTLTDTGDYGGVAPGWVIGTAPFSPASGFDFGTSPVLRQLGRCTGRVVAKSGGPYDVKRGLAGKAECRYRVVKPGRGWQVATANFSVRYGGLASYSQESWAALPKESVIEGYVRGKPQHPHGKGVGLTGVKVKAAGRGGATTTTNSEGFYAIELPKPGRYDVIPRLRASDERLRPRPHFTPSSRTLRLNSDRVKDVSFGLDRGDTLRVRFQDSSGHDVTSIPADGASAANVVIDATDANDQPINQNNGGGLDLFVDNGRLSSRAIVCENNQRIWPGKGAGPGLGGPAPVYVSADAGGLGTDAKGVLQLTVYSGTQAGTLELTARVHDPSSAEPGVSNTLTLAAPPANVTLEQAVTAGKAQDQSGFPNANGSYTSIDSELDWLQGAKQAHLVPGWEYAPVAKSDGTGNGIYFYKNGSIGTGGVLNSDSRGFQPLLDGSPLPSLQAWAGPTGYHFFLRSSGYHGDRFFYFGWPYERGAADSCIRNGPD